jgi:hypothetical protein
MLIHRTRIAAVAVMTASVLVLAGADEPLQTIKADELTFKVPSSWKSERPKSAMRKAQLKVAPVKGDTEPAELVVTSFGGGGGGVEANVARWESQFEGGAKAKVEKKKGTNIEVTRVEISGHFVAPVTPGSPEKLDKPEYRLLGAIVITPKAGYFFKMVGPDKTMQASREGFDALIASITKED